MTPAHAPHPEPSRDGEWPHYAHEGVLTMKTASYLALLSTTALAVAAPTLLSLFCVLVCVVCATVNVVAESEDE